MPHAITDIVNANKVRLLSRLLQFTTLAIASSSCACAWLVLNCMHCAMLELLHPLQRPSSTAIPLRVLTYVICNLYINYRDEVT
jgi:hypothetical protein